MACSSTLLCSHTCSAGSITLHHTQYKLPDAAIHTHPLSQRSTPLSHCSDESQLGRFLLGPDQCGELLQGAVAGLVGVVAVALWAAGAAAAGQGCPPWVPVSWAEVRGCWVA